MSQPDSDAERAKRESQHFTENGFAPYASVTADAVDLMNGAAGSVFGPTVEDDAVSDRIMRSPALAVRLGHMGSAAPTREQAAVVMHALADHTAIMSALVRRVSGPPGARKGASSMATWFGLVSDQLAASLPVPEKIRFVDRGIRVGAETAAHRLMRSMDMRLSSPDTEAPSVAQVSALLVALDDDELMDSALRWRVDDSSPWPQATSMGRWLHDVGDQFRYGVRRV